MWGEVAAIGAAVVLFALAIFQLALASGAPLGHLAWGGQQRVLPPGLRVASLASIAIYALFALVLADRAGLVAVFGEAISGPGSWAIAGYGALGTLVNAISRSRAERLVMTPVALGLGLLALVVAMS
jgi:hypothetical protein